MMRVVKISVKELVEYCERSGDINFRFSSRSSALAGIRGHQRVQRRRKDSDTNYVAEKTVADVVQGSEIELSIGGRVDGYCPPGPAGTSPVVEEIKTIRTDPAQVPVSVKRLHWGQAKVYAYLLTRADECSHVRVRLCYLQLADNSEMIEELQISVTELQEFYEDLVRRYLEFVAAQSNWILMRDQSIATLTFPYGSYRAGQRAMAVGVYRALKDQAALVLQAPTGIGKTMAAIFPAIKALSMLAYDKVFYLTAKGSGQQMAKSAVADLKASGLQVRDVTLTAKDKVCLNPGSPCDPDHCEFAAGYYDRLGSVLSEAICHDDSWDQARIEALARSHCLCPFELSLDLARIADVVICDYNYLFDPTVYLRRFFEDTSGKYALLADESHNLVDRGREMFSAALTRETFMRLKRAVGPEQPLLTKRIGAVSAGFLALKNTDKTAYQEQGYLRFEQAPATLVGQLRRFCEAAEETLQENRSASWQQTLLDLYFDSLRFIRVAELFDRHYACLLASNDGHTLLKLNCINPSPGLAAGFGRVTGKICFSATMAPIPYFRRLLGIEEDAKWYRIPSPFDPDNLGVFSASFVSTAYKDRADSLGDLVSLVNDVVTAKTGNYLVYFPSHAYLNDAYNMFVARNPNFSCIRQTGGMDSVQRDAFLFSFNEEDRSKSHVGFAVMGGVFGEGIDLKGTRLIGVVIAGVGLPQIGVERELIREYFDNEAFAGQGFNFAYQFPGINRVLQTAGRVIRSESDRGIVCLVDPRFAEHRYRMLLPEEWRVQEIRTRHDLPPAIKAFWSEVT